MHQAAGKKTEPPPFPSDIFVYSLITLTTAGHCGAMFSILDRHVLKRLIEILYIVAVLFTFLMKRWKITVKTGAWSSR